MANNHLFDFLDYFEDAEAELSCGFTRSTATCHLIKTPFVPWPREMKQKECGVISQQEAFICTSSVLN